MPIKLIHAGAALAAVLATPALLAAPHRGPARPAARFAPAGRSAALLEVNTGRGRLVNLSAPMSDLFVANEAIADVQVRSPTQLYVFGKKTGETTISATARSGQVLYTATVRVGDNRDEVQRMLGLAMPDARIVATPMNGLVLLTGTVAGPADAAEAERLTQAFVGADTRVLSRLKSATPLQVMLQVRIAEVSRSFVKNIGVNLQSIDSTSGFKTGIAQGRGASPQFCRNRLLATGFTSAIGDVKDPATGETITCGGSLLTQVANGTSIGGVGKLAGLDLIGALDLGETIGQVSTLATPTLTALSGETATFLVGGQIPIPVSQGLGAVSVEYKNYGVSLAFSPTVLADGRISMRVKPEVSQLSAAGAVTISGTSIPALITRSVETSAEMGSGESMVIGGLLSNSHDNSITKTPGLGDVPILGSLFRSNGWKRNETELVIVITPVLVKPIANQADVHLPTDGEKAPTDLQRVLLGKLGDGTSGAQRPVPTMAPPVVVAPSLGLAAPAPALPTPAGSSPLAASAVADPRAPARRPRKGGDAAPGFSN